MKNTYYKWTFKLDTGTLEVNQTDSSYHGECLDYVDVSINRHGISLFYMYSKRNDRIAEREFIKGISEILQSDISATARMHELALGRFYQFDKFLRERE